MQPASTFFSADNRSFVVMSSKRPRQRLSGAAYKRLRRDRKREEQQGATALQRFLHATEENLGELTINAEADEGLTEFVPEYEPETEPLAELNAESQAQSESETKTRPKFGKKFLSKLILKPSQTPNLRRSLNLNFKSITRMMIQQMMKSSKQMTHSLDHVHMTPIYFAMQRHVHIMFDRLKTELVMRGPLGLQN